MGHVYMEPPPLLISFYRMFLLEATVFFSFFIICFAGKRDVISSCKNPPLEENQEMRPVSPFF